MRWDRGEVRERERERERGETERETVFCVRYTHSISYLINDCFRTKISIYLDHKPFSFLLEVEAFYSYAFLIYHSSTHFYCPLRSHI